MRMEDRPGTSPDTDTVELGRTGQDIAAVLWPSFLVACVATMVTFALFDPADLGTIVTLDLNFGTMTGYALGFFFFWALCAASSYVTLYMVRTAHRARRIRGAGTRKS